MRTRYVYLDANGSAFTNRTETSLWKDVGFGLAHHYWISGEKRRALGLWKVAGYDLGLRTILAYKAGLLSDEQFEKKMYGIFNPWVLEGAPYPVVNGLVFTHASIKAAKKIRRPVLEAVRAFKDRGGTPTIVSTGCRKKIADALYLTEFRDVFPEPEIVANNIEHRDGRVVRFPYDGIRPEAEVERLMAERSQNPGEVACMVHDYRALPLAANIRSHGGRVLIPADADKKVMDRAITLRAQHWENPDQLRGLLLE